MKIKQIEIQDFEEIFGESLSTKMKQKIASCDLSYHDLSSGERDTLILSILETIDRKDVKKSGPHRLKDWVLGWGQNFEEFSETTKYESLVPKYFGKFPYVRWKKDFIKPAHKNFEYNMVKILQYWIFEKHFATLDNVYEFGCGTGHNLFRVEEINNDAKITGLDWAGSSQESIKKINEVYKKNFGCEKFDFFNINKNYNLGKNSGVYTFAALEQVGGSHEDFIKYLIEQDVKVCVHIEPIAEMLNPRYNLIDYLSVKYFKKRDYLNGFVDTLHNLHAAGEIEIIQQQRSYIGSLFVDGYSVVAWRPKNA